MTDPELRQLLRDLDTALLDWMRLYASEQFTAVEIRETLVRIDGNRLAYIAGLRERVMEATK